MQWQHHIAILFCAAILFLGTVRGSNLRGMFVFGDSYADTGNHNRTKNSWHAPYGTTFPGKPTGRYSDGRVLTDFVASFFSITAPVPYQQRNRHPNLVALGSNFAYGGAGVTDTVAGVPNVSVQIDQLQQLIAEGLYSAEQLHSSLALLSVSGIDYTAYIRRKKRHAYKGIRGFERSVVKQISRDVSRLYKVGIRKFAVTGMDPLGCWPWVTVNYSFKHCDDDLNKVALHHNLLLEKAAENIKKTLPDVRLAILDQYKAFMSILHHPNRHGACFEEPLKPCCAGKEKLELCGNVDKEGKALYSVCSNPEIAFFWDGSHPTQAAWHAVMEDFGPSLKAIQI